MWDTQIAALLSSPTVTHDPRLSTAYENSPAIFSRVSGGFSGQVYITTRTLPFFSAENIAHFYQRWASNKRHSRSGFRIAEWKTELAQTQGSAGEAMAGMRSPVRDLAYAATQNSFPSGSAMVTKCPPPWLSDSIRANMEHVRYFRLSHIQDYVSQHVIGVHATGLRSPNHVP